MENVWLCTSHSATKQIGDKGIQSSRAIQQGNFLLDKVAVNKENAGTKTQQWPANVVYLQGGQLDDTTITNLEAKQHALASYVFISSA